MTETALVSISVIQAVSPMVGKLEEMNDILFFILLKRCFILLSYSIIAPSKIGDGTCDPENNTPECRYDG